MRPPRPKARTSSASRLHLSVESERTQGVSHSTADRRRLARCAAQVLRYCAFVDAGERSDLGPRDAVKDGLIGFLRRGHQGTPSVGACCAHSPGTGPLCLSASRAVHRVSLVPTGTPRSASVRIASTASPSWVGRGLGPSRLAFAKVQRSEFQKRSRRAQWPKLKSSVARRQRACHPSSAPLPRLSAPGLRRAHGVGHPLRQSLDIHGRFQSRGVLRDVTL
jgi:hypothetical protein